MGDEAGNKGGERGIGEVLTSVGDAIGDLVTGVPAPIRKNATRAFTRLCTAAVEYPAALMENAIAERRAESNARVKLIETSATQIAEQMNTDPEFARLASTKFAHKILRERVNIDRISQIAAEQLKSDAVDVKSAEAGEAPPISEDWLNAFEDEAAKMSSEKMQGLFGKILAGEIRAPASYSIKTVKLMAQLDNNAATLFQRLCSLSISLRIPFSPSGNALDARVVSMGSASSNSLLVYGLPFSALNILHEYGLIISDYNSYMPYNKSVLKNGPVFLPFIYENKLWAFVANTETQTDPDFKVNGVALSTAGKELLSIVDIVPDEKYKAALIDFFNKQGKEMVLLEPNQPASSPG